ncbi:hypothetical protein Tco_1188009, partial [Tanacetum coccineum]
MSLLPLSGSKISCLAAAADELSLTVNLPVGAIKRSLFRSSTSASGRSSLRVIDGSNRGGDGLIWVGGDDRGNGGDGTGSGGDGICRSGDDQGNNGDADGGDEGSAAETATMSALVAADIG